MTTRDNSGGAPPPARRLDEALDRALSEPAALRKMDDAELGLELALELLVRFHKATDELLEIAVTQRGIRQRAADSRSLSVGAEAEEQLRALEKGRRSVLLQRRKVSLPILLLARKRWPDPAQSLPCRVATIAEGLLSFPAASQAPRPTRQAFKMLGNVLRHSKAAAGEDAPNEWLEQHLLRLVSISRSDLIEAWCDELAKSWNAPVRVWRDHVLQATVQAHSPALPRTLNSTGNKLLLGAAAAYEAARRITRLLDLSRDAFGNADSAAPSWLTLLPVLQGEPRELALVWLQVLDSEGLQGSAASLALTRARAEAERLETDELIAENQQLTGRISRSAEEVEALTAEVAELRLSVAELSRHSATSFEEAPELGSYDSIAQLLTEAGRHEDLPERLSQSISNVRRSFGLHSVGARGEVLVDPMPVLFDFIGEASVEPVSGVVVRPAWLRRRQGGEEILIAKGAVRLT